MHGPRTAWLVVMAALVAAGWCWSARAADRPAPPRPTVVFNGDHDYPPFEFVDAQGQPQGFHIDLMRALGKVMGFNVRFQLGPWDEEIKAFRDGRGDVMALFKSNQRLRYADFTGPHVILFHRLFVRKGQTGIAGLADLAGKRVVVQRDAFADDWVHKHRPGAIRIPVETEADVLRVLASGQGDCALVTERGGMRALRQFALTNLTPIGPRVLPQEYCLAVRKGRTRLLGKLTRGLAIINANGTFARLYDKWLGDQDPRSVTLGQVVHYAAWLLAPLALLAVMGLGGTWALRRQVNRRTQALQMELTERRRAEAALRASERLNSQIVETVPSGILQVSADGRVVKANSEAQRLLGLSEDQFVCSFVHDFAGRTVWEDGSPCPAEAHPATRCLATGQAQPPTTLGVLRPDGRVCWAIFTAVPLYEPSDGTLSGAVMTFVDITQRKDTEEIIRRSQERFAKIFRANPVAIAIGSLERGAIFDANDRFMELVGCPRAELIGRSVAELGIWVDRAERQQVVDEVRRTGSMRDVLVRWRHKSGQIRQVLLSLENLELPSEPVVLAMAVDITERQQAQEALQDSEQRYRTLAESRKALLSELDHRVKNNLAGLYALVARYETTTHDVEAFAEAIRGKLLAMSAAHEIIAAAKWQSVELAELLRGLSRQFLDDEQAGHRLLIEGPAIQIAPRQAGPLAVILQELFTNCRKHGAYRTADGTVRLMWRLQDNGGTAGGPVCVQIVWQENTRRPVRPPQRKGQGWQLIEGIAHAELGGQCRFEFAADGMRCVLDSVLDAVTAG